MNRISKEFIKSIILLVLLVTSIVQVGILWDNQNHGLPFNFITTFFRGSNTGSSNYAESARADFFTPYRVVVSNGNNSHRIMLKEDDSYQELWNEVKAYLKDMLGSKQLQRVASDEWEDQIIKKAFVFEFKSSIDIELVKWFLDLSDIQQEGPAGIYMIAVLPTDDISNNTIYIKDDSGTYKYVTRFRPDGISKSRYEEIAEGLQEDKQYKSHEYYVFKEIDKGNRLSSNLSPDILFDFTNPVRQFTSITGRPPDKVTRVEEMAMVVLDKEKNSYDRSLDTYQTMVFKNTNNIYSIYSNGLLEYKYIPGAESSDDIDIGASFINAYRFIERLEKQLMPRSNLYLSGVKMEASTGAYVFLFDYLTDESMPVFIDYKPSTGSGKPIRNAIEIKANSKRMLECCWMMKNLAYTKDVHSYDIDINNMGGNSKYYELSIRDIEVGYVIGNIDEDRSLEPVWVIQKTDGGNNTAPLRRKEGN